MIKILFLSHVAGLGGSERSLLNLLKKLNRDKYEPLVLLPTEGPLKDEIEALGVKIIIYPIKRWIALPFEFGKKHLLRILLGFPKRIRFLCGLIKTEKINLVYTISISVIDGAIAARIKHIPHIYHIQSVLKKLTILKPYLPEPIIYRLINMFATRIIVPSKAVRECYFFGGNVGFNKKVSTVPNGIDVGRFSSTNLIENNGGLRSELKIGKDIKVIGLIGTFFESKGQDDFIEAAKLITERFQNVAFILTGYAGHSGKPFLTKLIEKTEKLHLSDKVHFLDFRNDIRPVHKTIDILVSASWTEAFPLTLIEGMAMKKPIVATRSGGPEEMVANGETGFLVPPKSPRDLANAVIKLISEPSLAEKMGEAGRERAIRLFSLERYVSSIESIIDNVTTK